MCNRMDGLEGQEGMWKAVQVMLVEEEGSAEHFIPLVTNDSQYSIQIGN